LQGLCDTLRDAVLSGDASKCASAGVLTSMCRAYIKLDASLCGVPPESRAANDLKKSLTNACKETLQSRKVFAQGLQALAASGAPRGRALAKAALGQPDACAAYAESAIQACLAAGGGTAPPQSPPPAPTAPPAPQGGPPQ